MYRASLTVEDEHSRPSSKTSSWLKSAYDSSEQLMSAATNLLSCDATVSMWRTWGASITKSNGKSKDVVDLRGKRSAEITTMRRPAFLSGPKAVDFTVLTVDDPAHRRSGVTTSQANSGLSEAPFSGSWKGKYYDGFKWQDADFTLFFQDIIGTQMGAKNNSGFTSLDMMGSCIFTSSDNRAPAAVVGSYNPDNGRVTWSQPAPFGGGMWEVWAQLYTSTSGGEDGLVGDRMLASWQDSEGRRGNMELVLREGDAFAVGGSFWSCIGLDPFVHEISPTMTDHATKSKDCGNISLPRGWSLPPGQPIPAEARLHEPSPDPPSQVSVPIQVAPFQPYLNASLPIRAGECPRAPAMLTGSVLEDPSDTLVGW